MLVNEGFRSRYSTNTMPPRISGDSMRRGAFIAIALMALSHFAFANVTAALAQAGSTGGTIGKTDKSLSGGQEQGEPQRQPEKKQLPRSPSTSEKKTGDPCRKLIGRWAWNNAGGTSETVFSSGGTGQNAAFNLTNTWKCSGGIAMVRWSNGGSDHVTISRDGNSLSILNPYGQVYSATRN
jgi:hypothetical protein